MLIFFRLPANHNYSGLPGWLKTPGKPSISHQTCADRLESCITWWYTIPSARRKFEAFSKFPEGFGVPWDTQTLGKPSIRHETLAWRRESCITWWYMFPSARRKFEPESKLILTFWYFEDVISKWRKSLKYRIPLTRIRPPQSRSHLILTFWSTSNRLLIEAEVSWSTVYYTSDFSEIWKWHLQNTKMSKSTSILVQTCAKRLETCNTMWYMIPSDQHKFEQETKLNSPFQMAEKSEV